MDIWLLSLERCFSPNSTDEQKIQALEWHLDGNAVLAISMLRFKSKTPSYEEAIQTLRDMRPQQESMVLYNQKESMSMYASRVYLDLLRQNGGNLSAHYCM